MKIEYHLLEAEELRDSVIGALHINSGSDPKKAKKLAFFQNVYAVGATHIDSVSDPKKAKKLAFP
ncbi:MAG: hypothetical protein WBF77_05560 [Sulfurimonadaceae bacterium]